MIDAMQAAGLQPRVLSGFRDYASQTAVHDKWATEEPERAKAISALPGHSEHQLGLALDFGSPELADLLEDPNVIFHKEFFRTSEGMWLSSHAHEYGFNLSYPLLAQWVTGFEYEPWHYRYVGVELAKYLWDTDQFLAEFLLDARTIVPCVP
jgi:D-alanyl-D-alanine carboxypeptidase